MSEPTSPQPRSSGRTWLWIGAGIAGVGVAAVIAFLVADGSPTAAPESTTTPGSAASTTPSPTASAREGTSANPFPADATVTFPLGAVAPMLSVRVHEMSEDEFRGVVGETPEITPPPEGARPVYVEYFVTALSEEPYNALVDSLSWEIADQSDARYVPAAKLVLDGNGERLADGETWSTLHVHHVPEGATNLNSVIYNAYVRLD